MNFLFYLVEFIITIILVLCYYKFVELRGISKFTKKNIPIDLKLFIQTQNVNVKKINYKKLMKLVMWVNAIDVAIVLLFTNLVENILLKLFISIPIIFIVLIGSYRICGYILKKKGLTIDESQDN